VIGREATPPPIEQVFETNMRIFESFDLSYARPEPSDEYGLHAHRRYARNWGILARGLAAAGDAHRAAVAVEIARTLAP
jgi:hypothetical protein